MNKLAVIFPGIGYHTDKPLLYYSRMMAREAGFDIAEVPYKGFPKRIRGDAAKTKLAFEVGLNQAEEILRDIDYSECDQILFLSKSIGTAIAAAYAVRRGLDIYHIMYTPLVETFDIVGEGIREGTVIAFHGTADPWADTEKLTEACNKRQIPLFISEGGNHSLETGRVGRDLRELQKVMEQTRSFVNRMPCL